MVKLSVYSWNVNGLRSCASKGWGQWLHTEQPDVLCLQETKVFPEQLTPEIRTPVGYRSYWNPAEKPGYSGVATFIREGVELTEVEIGIGDPVYDREGRVLTVHGSQLSVVNVYFPNSQREHARLPYRLSFNGKLHAHCEALVRRGKHVIICGDYNVAHQEIDLRNPKENVNNAGFLPQEREWMSSFLQSGYVDTFRDLNPEVPHKYSWWSFRSGVRERNIGWRLDYVCINASLKTFLVSADIHDCVLGSDHCPVSATFQLPTI